MDNFTEVPFIANNLDIYYIRSSILKSIIETLPEFKERLLDIGCGKMPYRAYLLENSAITEYIGLDLEDAIVYDDVVKPDFQWDGITMPFEDSSFETAFGTEVLEHCPEPVLVLKEVFRILKPGGIFFFTVPFLWNLHEVPHDEYRYTPFAMERILKEAGFSYIEIKANGGWHASLAQMLGLWVRRSNISARKRKYLSILLKPIIRFLIKKDIKPVSYIDGPMITGLYGIARKSQ